MNRHMLMAAFVASACGAGAITVQNEEPATVRRADGTVVVTTVAPKYTLNEAIELCITELEQRGETVSAATVKNRLQRMPKSDVDLNVKSLSRTIREVIEAHEAQNVCESPAPEPGKYDRRDKFVAAYVAWKTGGLTAAERRELHGQIGGEVKFRNDAKAEADKLWKANQETKAQQDTQKGNDKQ